jgi:threonine aldolase
MLGGGTRQVGVLAAAAEYALDHEFPRLHEDHAKAQQLATQLKQSGAVTVESDPPPTNMVYVRMEDAANGELSDRCRARGLRFGHVGNGRYRLVTHRDVSDADIEEAAKIVREEAERLLSKAPA